MCYSVSCVSCVSRISGILCFHEKSIIQYYHIYNHIYKLCKSEEETYTHTNTVTFKIRVAFNNAYRKIFGLPKRSSASTMYATHNICNFETMLRKNIYGFMQRLDHSTNTIIRNLYQSWIIRCDIWSSWIKSLYVM